MQHIKRNSGSGWPWEGLIHLISELKHYLPAQAPLKDFIHHNSLHAFQHLPFFKGLSEAKQIFGYRTTLSLREYRQMQNDSRIKTEIIEKVIREFRPDADAEQLKIQMISGRFDEETVPRIGKLRAQWHHIFNIDLETFVQPVLFRILCSYLDQGISIWDFPVSDQGFLASLREMEESSSSSFFKTKEAKELFLDAATSVESMLERLVGNPDLFNQYLFDQQFSHQGWSGMVSVLEVQPQSLLIQKKISLHDLIFFELLLEYDTLQDRLKNRWKPIGNFIENSPNDLFEKVEYSETESILELWQRSFEFSFYDQVLRGIQITHGRAIMAEKKSPPQFQAVLCIDDRECSYRRYLENLAPDCETYGTPGFFGVEFYFQPGGGKFFTKVCPAPVTPKYLIREIGKKNSDKKDITFSKQSHSFIFGWFIAQTIGFWSALRLFINIFRPSMGPAAASSLKHMDQHARLLIECSDTEQKVDGLQLGFTVDEMAVRVENTLKSIGLVRNFAPLVYIIGHGASSVNNPHYAAYDCGACSGRAGSVNARVFSHMANHPGVRKILKENGIEIPAGTRFIGGLRDTTRDELVLFDLEELSAENRALNQKNQEVFLKALDLNAKERSRRFESIDTRLSPASIHRKILHRSVSLFEPRPELNHATNALCLVGRRSLSKHLFLDRRSFLNSYDYQVDPEGKYLLNILNAAAPVCGGINLEYYFSRTDNQKLGAGTKLPHNVMGLFGVANGIDGDLRPGLPGQMIEVHDPVRLLMVVEHFPQVVLETIRKNPATYEWFENEWVVLMVVNPESGELHFFRNGKLQPYMPEPFALDIISEVSEVLETATENLPVLVLNN
jgi:uncharacterized protein YbcC (UPF0753/DUF2309 family)